ncbi:MAG: transposase [Spirochaetales bacterium]|nr:transposase [Spirochaetales bacterium]
MPGAEYHVTARANRQEFILESDHVKELFLHVLQRAKKKYDFKIRNFCIMSNHVHLMIRPGKKESLSKIMQWILSVFAIQFNKIYEIHGHVWYDRFRSTITEGYYQLLNTFLYIALNPVRAGLVQYCFEYTYNGIRFIQENVYELLEPPDQISQYGLFLLDVNQ